jgi:hypothetical protein
MDKVRQGVPIERRKEGVARLRKHTAQRAARKNHARCINRSKARYQCHVGFGASHDLADHDVLWPPRKAQAAALAAHGFHVSRNTKLMRHLHQVVLRDSISLGDLSDGGDMLNLVYHETQDEKVYQVISRRMKDRYDIFGGLPDTIEDDWIESVEKLDEMMDEYIHLRKQARDVFEMRYQETIDPDKDRWELCARVLARRDIVDRLSVPW